MERIKTNTPMALLIITTLVVLMSNCSKDNIWNDDILSMERKDYHGNQLRVDGYYYQKLNNQYFSLNIFFRNGILIAAGGVFNSIPEMDDYISTEFINNLEYKEYKSNWGVFAVEEDQLHFERWYPTDPPLRAYVRAGLILNDTTFRITESYRMVDGQKTEVRERDELYRFRYFGPKPDSTNTFIP